MACCGQTTQTTVYANRASQLSHANCKDVTIGLLNVFLGLVNCVIQHDLYTIVQEQPNTLSDLKVLLEAWITAKQADPMTCEFHDKLPIAQAIVNKIVRYGRC